MEVRRLKVLVCALATVGAMGADLPPISEASGVVRAGDYLLIVDDAQRGVYFRVPLRGRKGPVIPLEPLGVERIPIPNASLATDMESIGVLGDGRVVVLSERLRALFGPEGLVASYDAPLSEFGKRGLEGLAVRHLENGSSQIAVLWEGGYPEYRHLPAQLQRKVGRLPLRPMIVVHNLKAGEGDLLIGSSRFFELKAPLPKGRGPRAQRFRAPDLVWHRQPDRTWGFIAILSSSNSKGRRKYEYHWLQRFSRSGKRIGKPLDIDAIAPADLKGTNWEGLDWFEDGQSLVMVNESFPAVQGVAFVVELPDSWKMASSEGKRFTHKLRRDTEYFLRGPQKPRADGRLAAGTKVAMIEGGEEYCLVRTGDNIVAYVARKSLKPYKSD